MLLTLLFFILAFIYYPSHPPTPPSKSATKERIEYKKGILEIPKNKHFILCAFSYGVIQGFAGSFGGMLTPIIGKYLPDK